MKDEDKPILYSLVALIDIALLYTVTSMQVSQFEKMFIISLLVLHLILLYSVYSDNDDIIDSLHNTIPVYIIAGPFLTNRILQFTVLFFLIALQSLWAIKGHCIMNKEDFNDENGEGFFGNDKVVSIGSLLITVILANKLPAIIPNISYIPAPSPQDMMLIP